jgi:hypothetical protein
MFPLTQPVREPVGWHRLPEEKALADVAPQRLQLGPDGLDSTPSATTSTLLALSMTTQAAEHDH